MDLHEPIVVYTLTNPVEAQMIKNMLDDEGIKCFLGGLEQAADLGIAAFEIQVMVPAMEADRARRLIEQHEPHNNK